MEILNRHRASGAASSVVGWVPGMVVRVAVIEKTFHIKLTTINHSISQINKLFSLFLHISTRTGTGLAFYHRHQHIIISSNSMYVSSCPGNNGYMEDEAADEPHVVQLISGCVSGDLPLPPVSKMELFIVLNYFNLKIKSCSTMWLLISDVTRIYLPASQIPWSGGGTAVNSSWEPWINRPGGNVAHLNLAPNTHLTVINKLLSLYQGLNNVPSGSLLFLIRWCPA